GGGGGRCKKNAAYRGVVWRAREGAFDFLVYLGQDSPQICGTGTYNTINKRSFVATNIKRASFGIPTKIPHITGEQLNKWRPRIRPVRRGDEGQLHWLDTEEIISSDFQSFIHSPSVGCAWHIREFGYIYTLHIYKNVDLFEPTESEVLAFLVQCVPNQDLRKVLAYKVKQVPGEKINDHHLSYTRLYVPEPWRWLKLLLRRTGWA
ncbi:MAG: hypothetical protein AAB767_04360, partial [Patescibacteria group bacterium]